MGSSTEVEPQPPRLALFHRLSRIPGVAGLLRVSLFWKIFLANLALVAVAAWAGIAIALGMGRYDPGTATAVGIVAGSLVILLSLAVNAVLVRVALSPLENLEATAHRVRSGDGDARAPGSPVSDDALQRLVDVFNEMLDAVSVNRTRQKELARRVLESEERERQRIAHELYSGTAQTLAGVLVRLRIVERHLKSGANGSIDEIREEVVNALEGIRGVARRLRPPELDELGVRVALEAHARSMTEGRQVTTRFEGSVPELPREVSLALFRIVQEAISNAVLHAEAASVSVRFGDLGDAVEAEVVDDGTGFELGPALARSRSLGLFGMHERAGYVRGELSIESGPGRGTRVHVVIPTTEQELSYGSDHALEGTIDRLMDGLFGDNGEPGLATAVKGGAQEVPPI